jgi:hypothetical protein
MTSATWKDLPPAIFDPELGWIMPYGGGAETPEEKAAREKSEAAAQKLIDEATGPLKTQLQAEQEARKKEQEELAAYKAAEEKRKKDAMDETTRAKTEAEEAKVREAQALDRAKKAELEAARQRLLAKMAQDGKVLEAEFVPTITEDKDLDKLFEKAYERQQEVIKKHAEGAGSKGPFPRGGRGSESGQSSKDYARFHELAEKMAQGDRSQSVSTEWAALRRRLKNAGIDLATGNKTK